MGHISNSKGLRLGVSVDWPISYNINLKNINQHLNLSSISTYLDKFFLNKAFEKKGILFLNTIISPFFSSSSFKITVYYIDTRFLDLLKSDRKHSFSLKKTALFFSSTFQNNLLEILKINLSKLVGNSSYNFYFEFIPINFSNINSVFLVKFLAKKLQQRFSLNEVLKTIVFTLRNKVFNKNLKSPLLGYRFSCNGRFTRKQRATFLWERFGRLSLNTLTSTVDYTFLPVKLKNGICGLKFWVFLDWNRYNLNNYLLGCFSNNKHLFNTVIFSNLKFFSFKNVIKA